VKRAWPVTVILLSSLAFLASACSRAESAVPGPRPVQAALPGPSGAPSPSGSQTPSAALPRLVFFLNPHGRPCQIQQGVLEEMAAELSGKVELVHVRTDDRNDLARFEQYGIRSLPALVLTDAAGRELRRATPGIQSPEQVRRLVAP